MAAYTLRHEVLAFIRATEDVLAPELLDSHLTTQECDILGYYLMAMSGERSSSPVLTYRLGMQFVRVEIAHFAQAAQSLIAVGMLSFCPLTEEEQVLIGYFLTRLQAEFVFPGH